MESHAPGKEELGRIIVTPIQTAGLVRNLLHLLESRRWVGVCVCVCGSEPTRGGEGGAGRGTGWRCAHLGGASVVQLCVKGLHVRAICVWRVEDPDVGEARDIRLPLQ